MSQEGEGDSDHNPMADRFEPPESVDDESSDAESTTDSQTSGSTDNTDKTDKTDNTDQTDSTEAGDSSGRSDSTDAESNGDTRRNKPHTALYVEGELIDRAQERFDTLNAKLTLAGEEQVEKHAHFYTGLFKAALDRDDLEEFVLAEHSELDESVLSDLEN